MKAASSKSILVFVVRMSVQAIVLYSFPDSLWLPCLNKLCPKNRIVRSTPLFPLPEPYPPAKDRERDPEGLFPPLTTILIELLYCHQPESEGTAASPCCFARQRDPHPRKGTRADVPQAQIDDGRESSTTGSHIEQPGCRIEWVAE